MVDFIDWERILAEAKGFGKDFLVICGNILLLVLILAPIVGLVACAVGVLGLAGSILGWIGLALYLILLFTAIGRYA